MDACNVLNSCIERTNDNIPLILALCNGTDNKNSRLIGTTIEAKWFTTIEICSVGIETLDVIKKSSTKIFQQHLALSCVCERDVTVSVFSIFDLFGIKAEMINWDENMKSNFEGSLSIEVNTSSLSLYSPTRASKNNLIVQVVTGSINSPLKELWQQLLLLNKYLNILDEYKKNSNSRYTSVPLEFPENFISPYAKEHDAVMKNLNRLLTEDHIFINSDNIDPRKISFESEENFENGIRIQQYIQNLPHRYSLDFTDFLWELLIMNSNYVEITKCIYSVLEEIVINGSLVQLNSTNSTRIAKIIANPPEQKVISHLLAGSLPLEYIIDMGFEKLWKDYTYILINARFEELRDIQQKFKDLSCNEFIVDIYRKKLIIMVQIHVCLEFMLLLQDNLECPSDDLRVLFSCALKQYCEESPVQNCHDLHENSIYTLTAPLPVSAINNLNNEIPTVRRISLSSESQLSKLKTTTYYSQLPIFPTNIYPADDSNITDEAYYVTTAICSSNKFK
ncbi:protein zwilch homolog isoform X2 [Megachile rotundata]